MALADEQPAARSGVCSQTDAPRERVFTFSSRFAHGPDTCARLACRMSSWVEMSRGGLARRSALTGNVAALVPLPRRFARAKRWAARRAVALPKAQTLAWMRLQERQNRG